MPIVFAEISLKSGGGARTEGQFPPFRVRRSLTLHRCLCSRASYPLPRPSSVPSSREAHSVSGAVSVGSVHPFGTRSAERPRVQNAQERRTPKRTRTQNQNRISIFARMHGPVTLIPQQSRGYDTHFIGNRSVTRVFAGGSSISVWQGVNRGAVTPFRSERRFTPRLCLSSRPVTPSRGSVATLQEAHAVFRSRFQWKQSTPSVHPAQKAHSGSSTDSEGSVVPEAGPESGVSYPLPRASSVPTSRVTVLAFGADSAGLVHVSRTTIRSRLVPTQIFTQSRPRTRVHEADSRNGTQGAPTPPGPK